MLINKPLCGLKTCKYCFDGNCTNETAYNKCPVPKCALVVRCKDCRYGQYCTDGETTYQCFKWNSGEFGVLHEQDWFCADGERKDGGK